MPSGLFQYIPLNTTYWDFDWIINITMTIKVLDDFLFIHHDLHTCQQYLNTFISLCELIGVPIAHHKTEGPSRTITFLGIQLDTIQMEARLPTDKLAKYTTNISQLAKQQTITLGSLKSVIGQLSFATSVIPSGRPFLRRLHNLTIGKIKPSQQILLHRSAKLDLLMWSTFLANHNGKTIIRPLSAVTSTQIHLCADASKIGFGATYGKAWIAGTWPSRWKQLHISFLEMLPIYVAITLFASKLAHSSITFHSDNMGVVQIINKQTSKCPFIMQLIRPLILTLLSNNITLRSVHIPGKENILCDAISRLQVTPQLLQQYGVHSTPTQLPQHLLPTNFKLNWNTP